MFELLLQQPWKDDSLIFELTLGSPNRSRYFSKDPSTYFKTEKKKLDLTKYDFIAIWLYSTDIGI